MIITAVGERWEGVELARLLDGAAADEANEAVTRA